MPNNVESAVRPGSTVLAMMENLNSSAAPEQAEAAEPDALAEERFIAEYAALTGASTTQARNVYMYFDIIRQQAPYCQRLE